MQTNVYIECDRPLLRKYIVEIYLFLMACFIVIGITVWQVLYYGWQEVLWSTESHFKSVNNDEEVD